MGGPLRMRELRGVQAALGDVTKAGADVAAELPQWMGSPPANVVLELVWLERRLLELAAVAFGASNVAASARVVAERERERRDAADAAVVAREAWVMGENGSEEAA